MIFDWLLPRNREFKRIEPIFATWDYSENPVVPKVEEHVSESLNKEDLDRILERLDRIEALLKERKDDDDSTANS
jgi:hypothetical protein